jgi:hypothetical protein
MNMHEEEAVRVFNSGMNCAQAAFSALTAESGIDRIRLSVLRRVSAAE